MSTTVANDLLHHLEQTIDLHASLDTLDTKSVRTSDRTLTAHNLTSRRYKFRGGDSSSDSLLGEEVLLEDSGVLDTTTTTTTSTTPSPSMAGQTTQEVTPSGDYPEDDDDELLELAAARLKPKMVSSTPSAGTTSSNDFSVVSGVVGEMSLRGGSTKVSNDTLEEEEDDDEEEEEPSKRVKETLPRRGRPSQQHSPIISTTNHSASSATGSTLPRRGRPSQQQQQQQLQSSNNTTNHSASSSGGTGSLSSSGRSSKYKGSDTKRVESQRRRSRSRSQDAATTSRRRSRSRSQDAAAAATGSTRRRSKSQDSAAAAAAAALAVASSASTSSSLGTTSSSTRRRSTRSKSQDPVLQAQKRLHERRSSHTHPSDPTYKAERRRSKSQDASKEQQQHPINGSSGSSDKVRTSRQGRRPTSTSGKGSSSSKRSSMIESTSNHTPPTTESSHSSSAIRPRRSQSTPFPAVQASKSSSTSSPIQDTILAEYLGEGARAFDSILGLEPTTDHQTSGQQSNEKRILPSDTTTDLDVVNDISFQQSKASMFLSPQPPRQKVFMTVKNPLYSPPQARGGGSNHNRMLMGGSSNNHGSNHGGGGGGTGHTTTIFLDSMSKKVASDRWIQDDSVRAMRLSVSDHGPPPSTTATAMESLDARLTALDKDDVYKRLDVVEDDDTKSYGSADLTPHVPKRRGSKRLAGQKPNNNSVRGTRISVSDHGPPPTTKTTPTTTEMTMETLDARLSALNSSNEPDGGSRAWDQEEDDTKSFGSADLTPQAPRRRGSKRLAGQKPQNVHKQVPPPPPPESSSSSFTSPTSPTKKSPSLLIGSKLKSPQKQLRKIASKVVQTSKNIMSGAGSSGHESSPSTTTKSPKTPPMRKSVMGLKDPAFGKLLDDDDDEDSIEGQTNKAASEDVWGVQHDEPEQKSPQTRKRQSNSIKISPKPSSIRKSLGVNKEPGFGKLEDDDDDDDSIEEKTKNQFREEASSAAQTDEAEIQSPRTRKRQSGASSKSPTTFARKSLSVKEPSFGRLIEDESVEGTTKNEDSAGAWAAQQEEQELQSPRSRTRQSTTSSRSPKPSSLRKILSVKEPSFGRLAEDDSFEEASKNEDTDGAWAVQHDEQGILSPRTRKRQSVLQIAKNRVSNLLKQGDKSKSGMPDTWGALDDDSGSLHFKIDLFETENDDKGIPEETLQASSTQLDISSGQFDVDLAVQVSEESHEEQSRSSYAEDVEAKQKVRSKAAAEEESESVVGMPSDPEKHPLGPRRNKRTSRSSSPSKRNRSNSPSKSSHSTRRKSLSGNDELTKDRSSSRPRSSSLSKDQGNRDEEDPTTALERRRRERSRSKGRPVIGAKSRTSSTRDSIEGGEGDSRYRSPKGSSSTTSRRSSRSSSPHSLRSHTTSATTASARSSRTSRSVSNSPGNYRGNVSKRREALQKARSLKNLDLLENAADDVDTVASGKSGASGTGSRVSLRRPTKERHRSSNSGTSEDVGRN